MPGTWPSVVAIVPARNEAEYLPRTLPSLLAQEYPGEFQVLVVDDRSSDGTGDVARAHGVEVVSGAPLPEGWVGKVWALEQGTRVAGSADYLLLTDADIRHAPGSLRQLCPDRPSLPSQPDLGTDATAGGAALRRDDARLRAQAGSGLVSS